MARTDPKRETRVLLEDDNVVDLVACLTSTMDSLAASFEADVCECFAEKVVAGEVRDLMADTVLAEFNEHFRRCVNDTCAAVIQALAKRESNKRARCEMEAAAGAETPVVD